MPASGDMNKCKDGTTSLSGKVRLKVRTSSKILKQQEELQTSSPRSPSCDQTPPLIMKRRFGGSRLADRKHPRLELIDDPSFVPVLPPPLLPEHVYRGIAASSDFTWPPQVVGAPLAQSVDQPVLPSGVGCINPGFKETTMLVVTSSSIVKVTKEVALVAHHVKWWSDVLLRWPRERLLRRPRLCKKHGSNICLQDLSEEKRTLKEETRFLSSALEKSLSPKARVNEAKKERDAMQEKLRVLKVSSADLWKTLTIMKGTLEADQRTVKNLRGSLEIKQLERERLREQSTTLPQSLGVVSKSLHDREQQVEDLVRKSKDLAESLEALQQQCVTLEKGAQDIFPGYEEEDAEARLQSLASVVNGAIEAASLIVGALWPELEDVELVFAKLLELANRARTWLKAYQIFAAFEGALDSLTMMKAHYPKLDVRHVVKWQGSADYCRFYPSLAKDACFVAAHCDLSRILSKAFPATQ